MKRILIRVGSNPYPVYIGAGILKHLYEILRKRYIGRTREERKAIVITNRLVDRLYGRRLVISNRRKGLQIDSLLIPDEERFKNRKTVTSLYNRLLGENADRETLLIALGGGVIGDITGFVASTFLRGVPHIHIPTTLIAQVDSSIGGKTGYNLPQGKNLVGTFYHPNFVIVDPRLLMSLSEREYRSGLAEVVKYGCIASPKLFQFLEENVEKILLRNPRILERIIIECIRIKGRIVERDPQERAEGRMQNKKYGDRRILNFGHTFGHALENHFGYQNITHGEAISIGMSLASQIAFRLGFCSHQTFDRIVTLLSRMVLPTGLGGGSSTLLQLWRIMEHDKKVRGGRVHFVLPKRIGAVFITDEIERKTFMEAISDQQSVVRKKLKAEC